MFLEKALTKGILMLVKLVFLFSLILWILNRYFPSRNAAIGLRFPIAFSSLKKWQQIQEEFYRLLILSNGVLLLLSYFYKINPLKLNALSLLTVLASGELVVKGLYAIGRNLGIIFSTIGGKKTLTPLLFRSEPIPGGH